MKLTKEKSHKVDPEVLDYYKRTCRELLKSTGVSQAWNTIEGILAWVIEHNHITEKQMNAIDAYVRWSNGKRDLAVGWDLDWHWDRPDPDGIF